MVTNVGGCVSSKGSVTPHPKGAGPSAPDFGGSPSIDAKTFDVDAVVLTHIWRLVF